MPQPPKNRREFASLLKVVEILRGPDGCPWDKEQTHKTLTRFAIEEAHEFAEAVDQGQDQKMCEELGDLLLQVILNAEIARQEGRFDIYDVIEAINNKMIRRHPHVFSDVQVSSSAEVLQNWSALKAKEGSQKKGPFDLPESLPALLKAQKIGEKTKQLGFDWENAEGVFEKVQEEMQELTQEFTKQPHSSERLEAELGDTLFSLSQLARHLNLDAEQTLRLANQRFTRRYQKMQELVREQNKNWDELSPSEKEDFWRKAKKLTSE